LPRLAGWSRQRPIQRPIQRAAQRDAAALARRREERWPAIKTERATQATPSSGEMRRRFACCPTRRAPGRRASRWRVTLARDHLAAISGVTPNGRLVMPVREDADDAAGVVGFRRVLRREIRGKARVTWDGSPIHHGRPIKEYPARGAAARPHPERWPGDAPGLNPEEGIWNDLKRVELKNRCRADLAEVQLELRRAKERSRHERHIIRGCSAQCGYSV